MAIACFICTFQRPSLRETPGRMFLFFCNSLKVGSSVLLETLYMKVGSIKLFSILFFIFSGKSVLMMKLKFNHFVFSSSLLYHACDKKLSVLCTDNSQSLYGDWLVWAQQSVGFWMMSHNVLWYKLLNKTLSAKSVVIFKLCSAECCQGFCDLILMKWMLLV